MAAKGLLKIRTPGAPSKVEGEAICLIRHTGHHGIHYEIIRGKVVAEAGEQDDQGVITFKFGSPAEQDEAAEYFRRVGGVVE